MSQLIYKNGCWGCKRAQEDPQQKYVCPQAQQHLLDYQNKIQNFKNYAKKITSKANQKQVRKVR